MNVAVPPIPREARIPRGYLDAAFLACPSRTAADVAAALEVDVTTVSRWRRGALPLSRARWIACLAVLGLSLDWTPPRGTTAKAKVKRGRGRPRGSGRPATPSTKAKPSKAKTKPDA